MITIRHTHPADKDFVALVEHLTAELAERDGEDHAFYSQFNGLQTLRHVVVAYDDGTPVACGAMKDFDAHSVELKRMYTAVECRGKGVATLVLRALEAWATQHGVNRCVLETGLRQPEAIALYGKNGYVRISNYGPYVGLENSVCFGKNLTGEATESTGLPAAT